MRIIKYGETVEVGMMKTDGAVGTTRGDNRWRWLASGEEFAWAGNFHQE